MSVSYIGVVLRRLVVARADGLCEYCLIHELDTFFGHSADHMKQAAKMVVNDSDRPDRRLLASSNGPVPALWHAPWGSAGPREVGIRLLLPAAVMVLAGLASLAFDVPLSREVIQRQAAGKGLPTTLRELIEMSEMFGHGVGVAMLATALFVLDRSRRRAIPRLLIVTYGAGLAANLGKLVVARTRPYAFDLAGGHVWQTFEGWLHWGAGGNLHQSFPSAHTATAVAFAVLLSCLYPHAAKMFAVLAVLVGVQRLQSGAHFLSDVGCGAAVGWLVAAGSFYLSPFTRLMNRLEMRWAPGSAMHGSPWK